MMGHRALFFESKCRRSRRGLLAGAILAAAVLAAPVWRARAADAPAAKPAFQRRGFYLHGCWKYEYPFAVRSWKPADYHDMFRLLKELGFNTVMMWPVLEAVPWPLSEADRQAVRTFRPIVEDARRCGLETWLTVCLVTSGPEIAAKPWMERSLYSHMRTVRLDDSQEAAAYLAHRAALLGILNNADGYVTIDGDPGGYPGAKPADFLKVLLNDRKTIDRVGTHPQTQKIVPWIWAGWGTKAVWAEPIEPFVAATLEVLKQQMPEPWELLPGRSHVEGWANGRINMELVKKAGLLERSTLLCYEIIEFEPSPPAAVLQFGHIRRVLKQELALSPGARGFFGNSETPLMALPDLYLFARGVAEPSYLARGDEQVLGDLARFLGGPPELLVPAWSCLRLSLDELPAALPARLRAARLTGPAASLLPGGASRYVHILAAQADSQIRLLQACRRSPKTPEEAAAAIADGTAALVDWWAQHRWVCGGEGGAPFEWSFAEQYGRLKAWCAKHVTDRRRTSEPAVKELVRRGVFTEPMAKARIGELLDR
jgi:AcrR family transcriptional regulator